MISKTQLASLGTALLFALLLSSFGAKSAALREPRSAHGSAQPATPTARVTLDIIFQGTFAFVQDAQGRITAYTPEVPHHTPPYVQATNETQLDKGSYVLSVNSTVPATTQINPDHLGKIYDIFQVQQGILIDPDDKKFLSIQLPKPTAIVPLHVDLISISTNDPPPAPGPSDLYPTILALRYVIQDGASITITGPTSSFTPIPQKLGEERLVYIGVGSDESDDQGSLHARQAFDALVALFRNLHLHSAYPLNVLGHTGADCHAAMLLLQYSQSPATISRKP